MRYASLASLLRDQLNLDYPPVAVSLVPERPTGIPPANQAVPSSCSFWRRAEQGVFYASVDDHLGCPIGAMVMGFDLSENKTQELMSLVGEMCSVSYVNLEEVPHIPKFERTSVGAVYGPLAAFPIEPDVVMVWATPAQAMLLQEAAGAALWSETPRSAVFGRPTCAALPSSVTRGHTVMSLGCVGMRVFTEIPDAYCLIAVPASRLADLAEGLQKISTANDRMREFYFGRKSASA